MFEHQLQIFYQLNKQNCQITKQLLRLCNLIKPNESRSYFKIYYFAHALYGACYKNIPDWNFAKFNVQNRL